MEITMITVRIWNHSHHVSDDGQRSVRYLDEAAWRRAGSQIHSALGELDDVWVRFDGEGTDPAAVAEGLVDGRSRCRAWILDVAGDPQRVRDRLDELIDAHQLDGAWWLAAVPSVTRGSFPTQHR